MYGNQFTFIYYIQKRNFNFLPSIDPHLSAGAWASSATVLAQYEFTEYYEVVNTALHNLGGDDCFQRAVGAFYQAEELVEANNFTELSNLFRSCDLISGDDPNNLAEFFAVLIQPLAELIQYHR